MIEWILENRQWLFSGSGVAVVTGLIIVMRGYLRWRESRNAGSADAQQHLAHARVAPTPLRSRLPGFLLRAFLKPDDVRDRIRIGLREDAPGTISLDADIPLIDLYFQITNLSPVDLILDRLLVDVWFGQPTFSVALLHRYAVPAGEITQGIHVRQILAENQERQIETFNAAAGTGGSLYIYITAYFESKLGRLIVQRSIERRKL